MLDIYIFFKLQIPLIALNLIVFGGKLRPLVLVFKPFFEQKKKMAGLQPLMIRPDGPMGTGVYFTKDVAKGVHFFTESAAFHETSIAALSLLALPKDLSEMHMTIPFPTGCKNMHEAIIQTYVHNICIPYAGGTTGYAFSRSSVW
jgi:hypothetical protein